MRISPDKLKSICKNRGFTIRELLSRAGVSATAFYALARKDSVLPKSIVRIAAALDVPPADLLDDGIAEAARHARLLQRARRIAAAHPGIDWDNVWHTLLLLDEPPRARLNRGLLRGRKMDLHR